MRPAAGGQRGVLEAALQWRDAGRAFALVLVVQAGGSTYRKPGAFALVAEDGERRGTISGGCLEPAVEALGRQALAEGRAATLRLDTRGDDDLVFGSGSGCRGWMQVLAWPVPGPGEGWLRALARGEACGEAVHLAVDTGGARLGCGTATAGGERVHDDADGPGDAGAARAEVVVRPAPRLLLVGGGPEAPALLAFARRLGWWTVVCEHREALRAGDRLGLADQVLAGRPGAVLGDPGQRFDAAVVMSHQASTDLEALSQLCRRGIAYVGLLGPPARRDELLALLPPADRAALAGALHAPVGLPLGGEGPEAIALSVVAQVQQVLGRAR